MSYETRVIQGIWCRVVEGNKQDQDRLRGLAEQAELELSSVAAVLETAQGQMGPAEELVSEREGPAREARGRHAALLQELEAAR